ncbi:MAG: sigma-70 family RNA polymerase sigma factor [Planctomycetota bacterium]|nr:sigma-70 family RNA polymerase sigma factor [Planctomycetota bacterium]
MRAEGLFDILVRQHAEMLNAFIHSFAFEKSTVDDVFQETIITAWKRIDEFDRSRPFGPWLRGIARNHILSSARKNRRYRAHLTELMQQRIALQFDKVDQAAGDSFSQRISELHDCIARLKEDAHEAIDLVYVRGLDAAAAAKALGTTDETFRKRLYRARLALAECLRTKSIFAPATELPPTGLSPTGLSPTGLPQ